MARPIVHLRSMCFGRWQTLFRRPENGASRHAMCILLCGSLSVAVAVRVVTRDGRCLLEEPRYPGRGVSGLGPGCRYVVQLRAEGNEVFNVVGHVCEAGTQRTQAVLGTERCSLQSDQIRIRLNDF